MNEQKNEFSILVSISASEYAEMLNAARYTLIRYSEKLQQQHEDGVYCEVYAELYKDARKHLEWVKSLPTAEDEQRRLRQLVGKRLIAKVSSIPDNLLCAHAVSGKCSPPLESRPPIRPTSNYSTACQVKSEIKS